MHSTHRASLLQKFWLGLLLFICVCLVSCTRQITNVDSIILTGRTIRVISGQTIEVKIFPEEQNPQRVRLIGIDVPKLEDKNNSEEAKQRLQELINNQTLELELESQEKDRYNRILAHVWLDKVLLSEQLAKEGYVIANTKYPHKYSDRIFYAQEYARILGYRIWQ